MLVVFALPVRFLRILDLFFTVKLFRFSRESRKPLVFRLVLGVWVSAGVKNSSVAGSTSESWLFGVLHSGKIKAELRSVETGVILTGETFTGETFCRLVCDFSGLSDSG